MKSILKALAVVLCSVIYITSVTTAVYPQGAVTLVQIIFSGAPVTSGNPLPVNCVSGCSGGATGANPTATAGPAAINGSATTFLRSDGAPAVQKGSASQFGIIEVDNTTITAASGVISATGTLPLAPSNLTFYGSVSGTGTACTSGTPCAAQTAINQACSYNYQGLYAPTVNLADGTYPQLTLCPVTNFGPGGNILPGGTFPHLVGDAATPANAIITTASGNALQNLNGAIWSINGFQLKSTSGSNADLWCVSYCTFNINNIDFAGSGTLLNVSDHSNVYAVGNAITSSSSSFKVAVNATFYGNYINDTGTWTIGGSPTVSNVFANVGDHAILGTGTYVNAGTVTGPKFTMYNYGLIEYASSQASFPGSTSGSFTFNSIFAGDGTWAMNGFADYNITSGSNWNFNIPNGLFNIISANANATEFALNNSSTGGHEVFFLTGGVTGLFGIGAGQSGFVDASNGNVVFYNDTSGNVTYVGGIGWSALGAYAAAAPDVMISRTAAATLAVGNGTAGNKTGKMLAANFIAGTATATVSSGEIAQTKITASGSAPGAGAAKFEWVTGTNAGSCKLISYAGTSTTPVIIVDNVGSGC